MGTDGWGKHSLIDLSVGGAFAAEVVLTFLFVLVVLAATSHTASAGFAGLAIGMALTVVHLIGIPLTGTSVNPARSLGPAIMVGGDAIKQVWLFIVAPLVGGVIAALVYKYLLPTQELTAPTEGMVEASDLPTPGPASAACPTRSGRLGASAAGDVDPATLGRRGRMASMTTMEATPSTKVAGAGSPGNGRPSAAGRAVSNSRV